MSSRNKLNHTVSQTGTNCTFQTNFSHPTPPPLCKTYLFLLALPPWGQSCISGLKYLTHFKLLGKPVLIPSTPNKKTTPLHTHTHKVDSWLVWAMASRLWKSLCWGWPVKTKVKNPMFHVETKDNVRVRKKKRKRNIHLNPNYLAISEWLLKSFNL